MSRHKTAMTWTKLLWIGWLGVSSGCAATLSLEVLKPAELTVPGHIQQLAYVDRSRARNLGQDLMGALEGAISGEGIGADTEGREGAAYGLLEALEDSPRFQVFELSWDAEALESSLFDQEMSPGLLREICASNECQGVVALEAFDSDVNTEFSIEAGSDTVEGKEVTTTEWTAIRTLSLLTSWRLYDASSGELLDQYRTVTDEESWTGTGRSKSEAREDLQYQAPSIADLASSCGLEYGQRIAPHYVWVNRGWFGGGNENMKLAKQHFQQEDWEGASTIWRVIFSQHPDPKLRAKARHNLALIEELGGDLDGALSGAQEAFMVHRTGVTRRYLKKLRRRVQDEALVRDQMDVHDERLH